MKKNGSVLKQAGFTLIEILVTLILISLLVAAVFPVVTQQINQADAPRLANDLVNVRSGMEMFNANLRNRVPNGLDVLVFETSVTGTEFGSRNYDANTHQRRWNGPYIDAAIPTGGTILSGFDATIANDFLLYVSSASHVADAPLTTATTSTADFVAVPIGGLTAANFASLNDLVDGETDTGTSSGYASGKLRALSSSTASSYYLAIPFRE